MSEIKSITRGPRDGRFELLRILAMFFVLTVHADYAALDQPTSAMAWNAPLATWVRVAIEMLAIVSVNIFVLISGWFGIRATWKGFWKLIFQVWFISVIVYLTMVSIGQLPFAWQDLWRANFTVWFEEQWFVLSYIILFLLSPVLNAFVEKASRRELGDLVVGFYVLQTVSSFLMRSEQWAHGYSAISFVGLYFLARWLRLYGRELVERRWVAWAMILVPWALDTVVDFYAIRAVNSEVTMRWLQYSNPFIVIQSAGFLLLFAGLRPFVNRVVNVLSGGAFAVYLLNMNPWLYIHFKTYLRGLYARTQGIDCLGKFFLFLVGFFLGAVLVDFIRQTAWKAVEKVRPSGQR